MKRNIFTLLILSLLTITFSSCDGDYPEHFMGHTYAVTDIEGSYMSFQFFETGTCFVTLSTPEQHFSNAHFTYTYERHTANVYFDDSDTWKESARGTLYMTLSYDYSTDTFSAQGLILHRID